MSVEAPLAALALIEIALRFHNPHRLWRHAFDESMPHEPDPDRGWRPRPDFAFDYHHRYLKGTRRIRHNSLGLVTPREFGREKPPGVYRVLLFGETSLLGWELEREQRIAERLQLALEGEAATRVEVVPVAARNYGMTQLYTWYRQIFDAFDYDLLVYFFNENNPRRSVTFHESGKPVAMSQPLWRPTPSGLERVACPEVLDRNDMIHLNAAGEIAVRRGRRERGPHVWLRDHSHVYCALCDLFQGRMRLRDYKDRYEIKDIEKWTNPQDEELPYQWRLCRDVLREWAGRVHDRGARMIVVPNLQYYHAGNNWLLTGSEHPWGFDYEQIPGRVRLARVCGEAGLGVYDTYRYVRENRIDTRYFYLHPRYAYFSAAGARFQAEFLKECILAEISSPRRARASGRASARTQPRIP